MRGCGTDGRPGWPTRRDLRATSAPTMPSASFRMTFAPRLTPALTCSLKPSRRAAVNAGRRPWLGPTAACAPKTMAATLAAGGDARRRRSGRARPARSGDRDALTVVFRSYQPAVLRYSRPASRRARGPGCPHVARVARNLATFSGGTGRLPAIGCSRSPAAACWTSCAAADDDQRTRAAPLPELEVAGDEFQVRDDLTVPSALVRRLPPDQADAVLLRIVAGMDVGQVANRWTE